MGIEKPKTVAELFEFYYDRFKPIYSHVEALNQPPIEMFFEVNAAFDHLSRNWHYHEDEVAVVGAVAAHLKRGCFDAFKIFVKEARDQYDELRKVDTSIIDNGEYERGMIALFASIKQGATKARMSEGNSRDPEAWHGAFELWDLVYADCVSFEKDFFLNPKVEWARRKMAWKPWKNRLEGFLIGVAASVIAGLILWCVGVGGGRSAGSREGDDHIPATQNSAASSPTQAK